MLELISNIGWYVFAGILIWICVSGLLRPFFVIRCNWEFWRAPQDVFSFNGNTIPDSMLFFIPPPDDIGEVLFANSSLSTNISPPSSTSKLLKAVIFACVGLMLGGLLIAWGDISNTYARAFWLMMSVLGFVLLGRNQERGDRCTFIGSEGARNYDAMSSGQLIFRRSFLNLRFADATSLRKHEHKNSWSFTWLNSEGCKVFRLGGFADSKTGKELRCLADAVEQAWLYYNLMLVVNHLRRSASNADSSLLRWPRHYRIDASDSSVEVRHNELRIMAGGELSIFEFPGEGSYCVRESPLQAGLADAIAKQLFFNVVRASRSLRSELRVAH